jgi:hypothetical protein
MLVTPAGAVQIHVPLVVKDSVAARALATTRSVKASVTNTATSGPTVSIFLRLPSVFMFRLLDWQGWIPSTEGLPQGRTETAQAAGASGTYVYRVVDAAMGNQHYRYCR